MCRILTFCQLFSDQLCSHFANGKAHGNLCRQFCVTRELEAKTCQTFHTGKEIVFKASIQDQKVNARLQLFTKLTNSDQPKSHFVLLAKPRARLWLKVFDWKRSIESIRLKVFDWKHSIETIWLKGFDWKRLIVSAWLKAVLEAFDWKRLIESVWLKAFDWKRLIESVRVKAFNWKYSIEFETEKRCWLFKIQKLQILLVDH